MAKPQIAAARSRIRAERISLRMRLLFFFLLGNFAVVHDADQADHQRDSEEDDGGDIVFLLGQAAGHRGGHHGGNAGWAFNLKGPGKTLIQGVIDLCFLEEGQWVLVDYKTDAADGPALLDRYAVQLRWYAKALARITGRSVRETLLFGLRAGEAYPVPPAP